MHSQPVNKCRPIINIHFDDGNYTLIVINWYTQANLTRVKFKWNSFWMWISHEKNEKKNTGEIDVKSPLGMKFTWYSYENLHEFHFYCLIDVKIFIWISNAAIISCYNTNTVLSECVVFRRLSIFNREHFSSYDIIFGIIYLLDICVQLSNQFAKALYIVTMCNWQDWK